MSKLKILLILLTLIPGLGNTAVFAQSTPSNFCQEYQDLSLLQAEVIPTEAGIVTKDTISQERLSIPSLWWAEEQHDRYGGRLIVNWIAYQNENRVDLVVNRQLWALADYIERYSLVSKIGTTAKDFGYNMQVFNQQGQCLAVHVCNFNIAPTPCKIDLSPGSLLEEGFEL